MGNRIPRVRAPWSWDDDQKSQVSFVHHSAELLTTTPLDFFGCTGNCWVNYEREGRFIQRAPDQNTSRVHPLSISSIPVLNQLGFGFPAQQQPFDVGPESLHFT